MNEESRKRKDANVKENCGTCIHAVVCAWKGRYANEVSALVHEMQTSTLIQYAMKCKYHTTNGGCTFDLKCELEADNG